MLGSFLPRALLLVLGYAYPAYKCYKTVEKKKPENKEILFWCQYWILIAMLTVLERVGDALFSWLPIYSVAKLALFIYIWSSKVKEQAACYVYNRFFRDFVSQHELEIDGKILEFRVKSGDIANLWCQKALNYGHKGVFEILQYVSSRSASLPRQHPKEEKIGCGESNGEAKEQRTSGEVLVEQKKQEGESNSKAEATEQIRGRSELEEKQKASVSVATSSPQNGMQKVSTRKHWFRLMR